MHESPHAFPFEQTLQQSDFGRHVDWVDVANEVAPALLRISELAGTRALSSKRPWSAKILHSKASTDAGCPVASPSSVSATAPTRIGSLPPILKLLAENGYIGN